MITRDFDLHPRLTAVFTSVADGDLAPGEDPGAAAAVRERIGERLGLRPDAFRRMSQVHSTKVGLVSGAVEQKKTEQVDALLDPEASSVPLVLTADCVPVVFGARGRTAEDSHELLAVAHAGRKGLLGGILSETVRAIRDHGGTDLEAWIGPSICGHCYEVPRELAAEAEAIMPGITSVTSWGTTGLDLPGAARRQLEGLGVLSHVHGGCTLGQDDWYSYRGGDRTGRNGSFGYVRPDSGTCAPADPGHRRGTGSGTDEESRA